MSEWFLKGLSFVRMVFESTVDVRIVFERTVVCQNCSLRGLLFVRIVALEDCRLSELCLSEWFLKGLLFVRIVFRKLFYSSRISTMLVDDSH